MTRDEAIAVLKRHEAALRQRGVAHAGLFGSLARGEAHADSDIDVMVRFDPEAPVTLWDYAGLKRYVAALFRGSRMKVDVIDLDGMSRHVRPNVERDAIYAF